MLNTRTGSGQIFGFNPVTLMAGGAIFVGGYLFGDDVLRAAGFDVDYDLPGDIDLN